jgi:hypothetical protein
VSVFLRRPVRETESFVCIIRHKGFDVFCPLNEERRKCGGGGGWDGHSVAQYIRPVMDFRFCLIHVRLGIIY